MEIGNVATVDQMVMNLATSTGNDAVSDAVGIAMLKKALQLQASSAAQMLQAVPQITPSANLPPHLGQNVNTTA